ncbi:MAG: hypothetical protein V1748_00710 [Actinomycetota bacterium]
MKESLIKTVSRLKAWLAAREYRPLWHGLAVLFIVACSLLLFHRNFTSSGTMMHVDMTFPFGIDRNMALYSNTWWQYGSVQNIWNTQRVFWAYPLLAVAKVLGLSTGTYILVLFAGTFSLAGISMYAAAFGVIERTRVAGQSRYAPYVGAVFAGLVFMYNPWSLSHLWPYFGYPAYAVAPLVLILLIKTADEPRPVYVVGLAVLMSVASTGPITVPWLWLLVVAYLLFHLARRRFSAAGLRDAAKVLLPLAGLYLVLNAMWILPYLYSAASSKPFVPAYSPTMSQGMLDLLSGTNSVLNNLRFASGWGMPVDPQVHGAVWVVLGFALPALSLAALLALGRRLVKDRVVVFVSLLFVLSVLLATGSHWILRRPYSWFALNGPGSSTLGWMLRAPDRWLFYAPLFYALLLGLLAARLAGEPRVWGRLLAVGLAAVVLVSFLPIAVPYADHVYDPAPVPGDYASVNEFVARQGGDSRVMWIPFARSGFNYRWAREKRVGAFNVYSSNANLNNLQDLFAPDSFYYWLESMFSYASVTPPQALNSEVMLQQDLASRLFVPFAARYMIYDRSVPGYRFGDSFTSDGSMDLDYRTRILDVYGLDQYPRLLRPATRTVRIDSYYDMLAVAQRLTADDMKEIAFIERGRPLDARFGVLDINDYERPVSDDPGFEQLGPDGLPSRWLPRNPDVGAQVSVESGVPGSRGNSLRVVNNSAEEFDLSHIDGPEVTVEPGAVYVLESRIRALNSVWTSARVEGFSDESAQWITLVRFPPDQQGTSEWQDARCSFWMPPGISRIRPVAVGGWTENGARGPGISWFDDLSISRVDESMFQAIADRPPAPAVDYRKLSPEKYEVTVEGSTAPFVMVFGEAYDPFWQVGPESGGRVEPTRLYSTINGFPMEGGRLDLTVEYLPQDWFTLGLIIALAALIGSLLFISLCLLKRRRGPARGPAGDTGEGEGPAGRRPRERTGRLSVTLWWAAVATVFVAVAVWWGLLPALVVASFPAALLLSLPPRLPLAVSLAVLLLCPVAILLNRTSTAETLAIAAYCLLALGVLALFARHLSASRPPPGGG